MIDKTKENEPKLIGYIIHPITRRIEYPLYVSCTMKPGYKLSCPFGYYINESDYDLLERNVTNAGYNIVSINSVTKEEYNNYLEEIGML